MKKISYIVGASLVSSLLFTTPLFAETGTVGATTNTTTAAPVTETAKPKLSAAAEAKLTKGKEKAGQEIDRRVEALNKLNARIQEMKTVKDGDKGTLNTELQAQINGLTALKAKINTDSDIETFKTDVKTITEAHRIYMLVIPRDAFIAASDRLVSIADQMTLLSAKLEIRITLAKNAGKDTSKLEAALKDLTAKLVDAKTQAQNGVNLVVPLAPDNGDKTLMEANKKAFTNARADLKAGRDDLKAARADVETIIKGLRAIGPISTGTTATTTTATTTP